MVNGIVATEDPNDQDRLEEKKLKRLQEQELGNSKSFSNGKSKRKNKLRNYLDQWLEDWKRDSGRD